MNKFEFKDRNFPRDKVFFGFTLNSAKVKSNQNEYSGCAQYVAGLSAQINLIRMQVDFQVWVVRDEVHIVAVEFNPCGIIKLQTSWF